MEVPNFSLTKMVSYHHLDVLVVVFTLQDNHLQVLLRLQPENDTWELPGQPVTLQDSLEETATRCIATHTGLKQEVYLEQLYTYGEIERNTSQRTISVVYFALVPADSLADCSANSTGQHWFKADALPDLAMDHGEIVRYALRRLRYKLEYTAVGFELLPENFSLSELQHTYELILGEKLDKRNFRRRILEAGIIEATPHRRMGEGRPAQLYHYRPDAVAEVKARRLFP